MPHRLVSEIPAGPPGVASGASEGLAGMKRFDAMDTGFAG